MTSAEIRKRFLDFFVSKGHSILPSSSLIPKDDSTTLFTGSGMQPLLPYFLGMPHPQGRRVTNIQKSFRAEDIEEVGDNRHTTFFEMLGNWSLGDYFKEEQLFWIFQFLTEEIKLDPQKIYVTVFSGDEKADIPRDTESVLIWKKIFQNKGLEAKDVELITEEVGGKVGMKDGRIFYYNAKKNWWSRSGIPENMPSGEPGGPDSEIFYDFQTPHDEKFGKNCHPNCDCGRFLEIGNSVFMQYVKQPDSSFAELPQKNVDFGGGLERISAASSNNPDVFRVDSLAILIKEAERLSGRSYVGSSDEEKKFFRIISDHVRALVFLINDGAHPSNKEAGYVTRRLMRRTFRSLNGIGIKEFSLPMLTKPIIEYYLDFYPELAEKKEEVIFVLKSEEEKYREVLKNASLEIKKRLGKKTNLNTNDLFDLYQSFGLPIESSKEMLQEKAGFLQIDEKELAQKIAEHKKLSRSGAAGKFKGGLADTSEMSIKYHTATHLLHWALRAVLGDHIGQKGSNITPEKMRFDFSHPDRMTLEEIRRVENLVNEKIQEGLPVFHKEMTFDEARREGALAFFSERYGERVNVYSIGDFSKEVCGGPHVSNTSELGHFKILKEESSSAGIRRIKAVLI